MSKRKPGETLTDRQRVFCDEYLVDLNGTAAAKRAGYSAKTARVMAQQNLENPAVINQLAVLMKERSERTQVTADRVITEVARLGFSDLRKLFDDKGALLPIYQWPEDAAAAVSAVEVDELFEGFGENRVQVGYTKKVKLWDKGKALEMLGRHLKLWVDRIEATGPNGGPIQTRNDGIDLASLTDDELEALEKIRHAADSRRIRN
jgi:phage terminase small subunit